MSETIVTFVVASTLLGIAPGPDNIFVLTQSALYGKRSGILITLGLCSGLVVHTAAVALGVAALIQTSVIAFTVLKVLGALYLLVLAWQAFRAPVGRLEAPGSNLRSAGALYRRGIIMNITNPKVSIFFLAFLPQFVAPEHGHITAQIFLLGGIFIFVSLVVFCLVAVLAGALGNRLHQSTKTQLYLNRIAGAVFAGLALKLATASVN
ncbi:LysE family translocator [Marinobacter salexigens]|uniref:LysE family translocator n=1 Tax=Marinobacter salexigens TaxID=1925763 RepID=UPI000C29377C|nr:LysE family translocator [Marinobacter salexigens]